MAEKVLEIRGLCKEYPSFRLKDVGFSLARALSSASARTLSRSAPS